MSDRRSAISAFSAFAIDSHFLNKKTWFSHNFQILIYLPEHLGRKWQYHSVGRLMSKLLHPGNSWKLLKREAMRLFLLWYQVSDKSEIPLLHTHFGSLNMNGNRSLSWKKGPFFDFSVLHRCGKFVREAPKNFPHFSPIFLFFFRGSEMKRKEKRRKKKLLRKKKNEGEGKRNFRSWFQRPWRIQQGNSGSCSFFLGVFFLSGSGRNFIFFS